MISNYNFKTKTIDVVLKESGDSIKINVDDYDPELHAKGAVPKPAAAGKVPSEPKLDEPAAAAEQKDPGLSKMNLHDAVVYVKNVETLSDLALAKKSEESDGSPRKGVLAAIKKREAEFKEEEE